MQYSTGTLGLTNGSTTVTGSGTAWVGGLRAGWLLLIPGEGPLLIDSVASNTSLTLARPYQGSTRSGVVYNAVATRGELNAFLLALGQAQTNMQATIDGAGQGKFADGTVAIPGVRWSADEDTGLYRPAANQIGAVTGGVRRWLLSNTAFQVDVPITGTAVTQSATDATAGRLMKVGDFGLGGAGASPAITLNSATAQGLYQYAGSDPNSPSGANGGVVFVQRHATTYIIQTAHRANDFQEFTRFSADNGATWSAWSRTISQRNLLGTVSQSGGVPTGAVIERGSNANGEYTRFADGTQICTRRLPIPSGIVSATGSLFMSDSYGWTYPAAFVGPPAVSGMPGAAFTVSWAGLGATATTATSTSFRAIRATSLAVADGMIDVMAIGRWF